MFDSRWSTFVVVAVAGLTLVAATPPHVWQAIEEQEALVRAQPNDPSLLNDLANLQALSGQVDAAEMTYQEALRLAPDAASIRYNLALLLQESDRVEDAVRELRRVVTDDPGNAWAHYQLGSLLHQLGKRREAIDAYAQAFSLDFELTFPEVNPHIIENELFTHGLLRSSHGDDRRVMAPMRYEDPSRITQLLLAVPEEAPSDGPAEGSRLDSPSMSFGAALEGASATVEEPVSAGPAGEPVLSPEEAAQRILGGPTAGGGGQPAPAAGPAGTSRRATPQPGDGEAPSPTRRPGSAETTPPPADREFDPEPLSTGRIELRLESGEAAAERSRAP